MPAVILGCKDLSVDVSLSEIWIICVSLLPVLLSYRKASKGATRGLQKNLFNFQEELGKELLCFWNLPLLSYLNYLMFVYVIPIWFYLGLRAHLGVVIGKNEF